MGLANNTVKMLLQQTIWYSFGGLLHSNVHTYCYHTQHTPYMYMYAHIVIRAYNTCTHPKLFTHPMYMCTTEAVHTSSHSQVTPSASSSLVTMYSTCTVPHVESSSQGQWSQWTARRLTWASPEAAHWVIHHLLQVAQWVLEEGWGKGVRKGRKGVGKGKRVGKGRKGTAAIVVVEFSLKC